MAVIITNIKASVSEKSESVIKKGLKKAGIVNSDTVKTGIYKTSLDARKQENIHFVHSVYAELSDERAEKRLCEKNKECQYIESSFR